MSVVKSRCWLAICYPENFYSDWEHRILTFFVGVDYCYIVHDEDKHDNGEKKKSHVHFWLKFPNGSRTQGQVISFLTACLEKDHSKNIFSVHKLPIPDYYGVLYAHDYFLHSLETCRLENKYQYSEDNLKKSPNFSFIYDKALSLDQNEIVLENIIDIVEDKGFTNYSDLYFYIRNNMPRTHQLCCRRNFSFLSQLTKGNYLRKVYWNKYIQHSENDPSSLPFDPNIRIVEDNEKDYNRMSDEIKGLR